MYKPNYVIFTDGSCMKLNKKSDTTYAGSGALILSKDGEVYRTGRSLGERTNNYAELKAILIGLNELYDIDDEPGDVIVVSDSKYCVEALESHVHKWAKAGRSADWMSSKGKLKNSKLFKRIYYNFILDKDIKLRFCHMNSHLNHADKSHLDKVVKSFSNVGLKISEKQAKAYIHWNSVVDNLASNAAKDNEI